MNLSELLDEVRTVLTDSTESSGDDDALWTDATLVRYINEAQRRFAKRSFILRDSTTAEVVQVTLEEGVTEYTLHPSILHVISARFSDASYDLQRLNRTSLNLFCNPNTIAYSPAYEQLSPGTPVAYVTDETLGEDDDGNHAAVVMRVYPEPRAEDAGAIITMRVVRMPLDELTTSNMTAVPEIPADNHMEMLDWAFYLALRKVDQEAGNPKRAAEFAASFESHVQEVRKLVLRKLSAPRPWGLGRGGFSWQGDSNAC